MFCCHRKPPVRFETLKPKQKSSTVLLPKEKSIVRFDPSPQVQEFAPPNEFAPVYSNVNAQVLKEAWETIIHDDSSGLTTYNRDENNSNNNSYRHPRVKLKFSDDRSLLYTYKHRRHVLGRPVYITVQFFDLRPTQPNGSSIVAPGAVFLSDVNNGEQHRSSMAIYLHYKYRLRDHSEEVKRHLLHLLELLNKEVCQIIHDWNRPW